MQKELAAGCLVFALVGCTTLPTAQGPSVPLSETSIPLPTATKPSGKGEDYFDPNRTGTTLYDTQGKGSKRIGQYFRIRDFSHTGDVTFRYARIDGKLITCLSRLRSTLGRPISVNSSYRNWAYNRQLIKEGQKASKTSYHISGKAADIHVGRISAANFASTLYNTCGCGSGLGVASRWFHVDTRGYSVQPWGYGTSAKPRLAQARAVHKQMCGGGRRDTNETLMLLVESTKEGFKMLGQALKEVLPQ